MKRLEGTYRQDRAINEAVVDTCVPACPDWLPVSAREEWDRLTPLLAAAGLVTRLDLGVLVGYCLAWSRLREAEEHIARDGAVTTTPAGYSQRSPWSVMAGESAKLVERLGAQLGLSPASRARVPASPPPKRPEPNRWDGLLTGDDLTPLERLRARRESA